ncbi:HIRAN domain-containing protein [Thermovibrio sp.]
MIFSLKAAGKELYLKEEPLGGLTFSDNFPTERVGSVEVYGFKVEVGVNPEKPFPVSHQNYRRVLKAAEVAALVGSGAIVEGAVRLKGAELQTLFLSYGVVKELFGGSRALNLVLEGLFSTFESERNPYFKELFKGEPEEVLKELLKEGYFARMVGLRYGEVFAPEEGKEVFLVREIENRADRNAVLVIYCDGRKLGYLKRELAAFVSPILDGGVVLTGKVVRLGEDGVLKLKAVGF